MYYGLATTGSSMLQGVSRDCLVQGHHVGGSLPQQLSHLLRDRIGDWVDVARDDLLRHRLRFVAHHLGHRQDDLLRQPLRHRLDLRRAR